MNTFMKTVRVVTDLVILAVMGLELKDQINKMRLEKAQRTGLELKDQINKMRLEKAQRTVAAARAATQQENNNE